MKVALHPLTMTHPLETPMKRIAAALAIALIAAYAVPSKAAELDTFDLVNVVQQYKSACGNRTPGLCHATWPSRQQLAAAYRLECTGYVMAKAYALADGGIDRSRLQVATFTRMDYEKGSHAILLIDGKYVLDNMTPGVRTLDEYARFNPVVLPTPWKD